MMVLIVTSVAVGLLYFIRRAFLFMPPRTWQVAPQARAHLAVLAALLFFTGVFGSWLSLNELLFVKRGVVFGPGYTDVTTQLWVIKGVMALSFCAAQPFWGSPFV